MTINRRIYVYKRGKDVNFLLPMISHPGLNNTKSPAPQIDLDLRTAPSAKVPRTANTAPYTPDPLH